MGYKEYWKERRAMRDDSSGPYPDFGGKNLPFKENSTSNTECTINLLTLRGTHTEKNDYKYNCAGNT